MKLPPGVRPRPRVNGPTRYEFRFTDQHGTPRSELRDSPAEAGRDRAKRLAEVRAGTYVPPASKAQTVTAYSEHYFAVRVRRRTIDDDRKRFEHHVAPHLGAHKLVDLRPIDVATWVERLKAAKELSSKSICNAHGVLHAMLERAVFEELIATNPAKLPKGMLPKKSRKPQPRFEREQLVTMISDTRLSRDCRLLYALMALTGMRRGEASGRRVRDYDRDAPELAALRCDSQYIDQPLKTSEDDDAAERVIPVHPLLRVLLEDWLARGFKETYGRGPLITDWLVPDPKTGLPRTENQINGALRRDTARVLGREYGSHPFRRAFISLARSDGARADVLERVTHNAAGDMIDVYTAFEWRAMCEAVASLRITLSGPASGPEPIDPGISTGIEWRRRESKPSLDTASDGVYRDFSGSETIGAVAKNPEKPRSAPALWAQAQPMSTVLEAALTPRPRGTSRHSRDIGHLVAPLAGRRNIGAGPIAMQGVTHVTVEAQDCLPFAGWHPSFDLYLANEEA